MPECPLINAPLQPEEEPILEKLSSIRVRLEILKRDRSTYVKSCDVVPLYDELIEQVEQLNQVRKDMPKRQNRVDSILHACFQLMSLAYLTIGKRHEAPAVYSAVSTIKRLVDHLFEAKFFSAKDLQSLVKSLASYRQTIERAKDTYSPALLTLLEARIEVCEKGLEHLQKAIDPLTPELSPTWEKLVSILRSLAGCCLHSTFQEEEFKELEAKLKEIEKNLDLHVLPPDDRPASEKYVEKMSQLCIEDKDTPRSLQLVKDLLTRCLLWVEIIKEREGKITESFRDVYEQLLRIRSKLEKLSLMHNWSLRQTDLYEYERQLVAIDEARIDCKFVDAEGHEGDIFMQRTLLYVLRKSYALIYQLIISSEPVSEALLPVYNQLTTLKKCLEQVKKFGGVSSARELYPYSMKLNSIDDMRVDGKFVVGNDIPDGQGSVVDLMEECFEMLHELKIDADEEEQAQGRVDGGAGGQEETPQVGVAA